MSTTSLQKTEPAEMAVARPAPSVADMLQAVVQKGVTADNVAAVESIVKLYERMEEKKAEREFAEAFKGLQSEMKAVKATKPVPNNDGTTRYCFAPYEEIMAQVRPLLEKHGFTVSFSTDYADGRLVKACTLQHVSGHAKSNKFAVRIGSGPPKATECQADGAASTYAKRFALCDALNIVCDKDVDAALIGDTVSEEQADELHRRVMETNSNMTAFLKFCGVQVVGQPTAADFQKIPAGRYHDADQMLRRKESVGR